MLETNDRYGDACIPFSFQEPLNTTKSENCLFLNVYRPGILILPLEKLISVKQVYVYFCALS